MTSPSWALPEPSLIFFERPLAMEDPETSELSRAYLPAVRSDREKQEKTSGYLAFDPANSNHSP